MRGTNKLKKEQVNVNNQKYLERLKQEQINQQKRQPQHLQWQQ